MKYQDLLGTTLALTLIISNSACGSRYLHGDVSRRAKAEAVPQERGQLRLPSADDEGAPLNLRTMAETIKYEGALLLWDAPAMSVEQVTKVAHASVRQRQSKAEFIDHLRNQLQSSRQQLADAKKATAKIDAVIDSERQACQGDPNLRRAEKKRGLLNWLDAQVQALQNDAVLASSADLTGFTKELRRYCDAKVYELASSRLLAANRFGERPSPLMLCETYYQERGYFEYGEDAQACDQEKAGGDYFTCIWRHGVLKTPLFSELATHAGPSDKPASCANSGKLRVEVLNSYLDQQELSLAKAFRDTSTITLLEGQKPLRTWVEDGFLKQKAFKLGSFSKPTPKEYEALMASCPGTVRGQNYIFDLAGLKSQIPQGEWSAYPELVQWASESGGISSYLSSRSVPAGSEAAGPFARELVRKFGLSLPDDRAAVVFTRLLAPLSFYAARFDPEGQAQPELVAYRFSVNDYDFANPEPAVISAAMVNTYSSIVNTSAEFESVRRLPPCPARPELVAQRAEAMGALEAAAASHAQVQAESSRLDEVVRDEQIKAALAVTDPGTATLFLGMELELAANERQLQVALKVANGNILRACTDFVVTKACDDGADAPGLNAIAFDPESGKLTIDALLSNPDSMGLAYKERDGDAKFNEWRREDLLGRTLRLEAYANRLGSNFRFMTGKAFILESGAEVNEGSFSIDNYSMINTGSAP